MIISLIVSFPFLVVLIFELLLLPYSVSEQYVQQN